MNTTLTNKQVKEQEKERAKALILDLLDTGADRPTIYTILRKVSASGMSREISLKVIKGGEVYDITYSAGVLLDMKLSNNPNNALRVSGVGMDMGFHLAYSLASVLFKGEERAGYKIRHEWL
jgi:hypothetical protein